MVKFYFLVFSIFLFPFSLMGQDIDFSKYRIIKGIKSDVVTPGYWILDDSIFRDTAKITIYYDLTLVPDIEKEKRITTKIVTNLGSEWIESYSLAQRHTDKISTWLNRNIKSIIPVAGAALTYPKNEQDLYIESIMGAKSYVNSEIWIDIKNRTLTERIHEFMNNNSSLEYDEDLPNFDWEITGQSDSLNGYLCMEAKTQFRGREWTVWFTPAIPLNYGPWKFNGLPGLILQAEDTEGHFKWDCIGITQLNEVMYYFEIPTKKQSKDRVLRYVKNVFDNPHSLTNGQDDILILFPDMSVVDSSTTLPYNPIERN